MIRKILSPIIYATSACLAFVVLIMISGGIHAGPATTQSRLLSIIIITLIFLFANYMMMKIEKLTKPTIYDHLRQACFWYLAVGYTLLTKGGMILILVLPIIINVIFLYCRRKVMTERGHR